MINQATLLQSLKADYESAKSCKSEIDAKIAQWSREYDGKPYGNENKGRSQIVSRDIKKQSEWQHAEIIEPFVSTPDIVIATPESSEDGERAYKVGILLNTQFCRQFDRFNFLTRALKVADKEGTVVIRTGWEYEEEMVEEQIMQDIPNPQLQELQEQANYLQSIGDIQSLQALMSEANSISPTIQVPKIIQRVKPIKNQPTAMVCRNEDIFIDPTCFGDMDKCNFVIHRYESDITTLKRAGVYKNLDKIKFNDEADDYKPADDTFKFKDRARKKLVVYEYWGNYDLDDSDEYTPIVCAWIDDVIIRLEDNPFPDKKVPFIVMPMNPVPFEIWGESNAALISDIQKIKTAIYRGFIDNMALSNNGQKGIKAGVLTEQNKKRYLSGENFEYMGNKEDFFEGHFNELPGSIFSVLELMNQEAESITGIKSFNQGITTTSLGATATGIQGVLSSASTRRLNVVRNISENLVKPLLRKWLAYDAEFLDEKTQVRITNEEFIWLDRADLEARISVGLQISTSDDNKAKASELAFLLQTLGPSENPTIRKIIMCKIAELYRMPDLAKEIKDFEPKIDPVAQKMQELEIARLEAEIELTRSRAAENVKDVGLKEAKTETEYAKAKNLGSKTDRQDLDYLHKYHGIDESRKQESEAKRQQYDINKETLKLLEMANNKKYI